MSKNKPKRSPSYPISRLKGYLITRLSKKTKPEAAAYLRTLIPYLTPKEYKRVLWSMRRRNLV